MKHSRSSAEVEIRDAVVARFRELWPDARIIHEMNVEHGNSRADVVAVQPNRLWIAEIKSERDKLDRLAGQVADFGPCCHGMLIAAHEKWTADGPTEAIERKATARHLACTYDRTAPSLLKKALGSSRRIDVWSYPEPPTRYGSRDWRAPREVVPWYHRMLMLLWADELRDVAVAHRVAHDKRTPAYKLAPLLSRLMTGAEIETAVCKTLRSRPFAEADPPVEARQGSVATPDLYRQEPML